MPASSSTEFAGARPTARRRLGPSREVVGASFLVPQGCSPLCVMRTQRSVEGRNNLRFRQHWSAAQPRRRLAECRREWEGRRATWPMHWRTGRRHRETRTRTRGTLRAFRRIDWALRAQASPPSSRIPHQPVAQQPRLVTTFLSTYNDCRFALRGARSASQVQCVAVEPRPTAVCSSRDVGRMVRRTRGGAGAPAKGDDHMGAAAPAV